MRARCVTLCCHAMLPPLGGPAVRSPMLCACRPPRLLLPAVSFAGGAAITLQRRPVTCDVDSAAIDRLNNRFARLVCGNQAGGALFRWATQYHQAAGQEMPVQEGCRQRRLAAALVPPPADLSVKFPTTRIRQVPAGGSAACLHH